ncbi:ABC transporter substrate-binding protein [Undibacterium sp.]|uniref:substrate-binding periplasmic protein n=1 Tax=Undibacterium sp. TaxID=1914977 RepID=UPI0025D5F405|nr:transporter substrate-binding domain-containing protein [Undibacterium sp.]
MLKLLLSIFLIFAPFSSASAVTISLVSEDNWYPYAALKDGKISGFAVDVIQAAYAKVGITVEFTSAPYSRCLMLTKTGSALGCFNSTNDTSLGPEFLFHEVPLFRAMIGIYASAKNSKKPLKEIDLRGHRIGVTHQYTYGDQIETDKAIIREVAPSDLSNLRKLVIGRSDYSLIYTRVASYLEASYPAEFKGKIFQVGTVLDDKLFVSFSKIRPESAHYARLLDQGLLAIRADGTYKKLELKWQTPAP